MRFDELIAGWIMIKYPSKKINTGYGYRTNASMKNQQTWDEANHFSAGLMIKYGMVLLLAGLVISIAYENGIIPKSVEKWLRPLLTIGSVILSAILLMVTTERHLKRKFPEQAE